MPIWSFVCERCRDLREREKRLYEMENRVVT